MVVTLRITCDNAAFGETEAERAEEVVRIVRRWADTTEAYERLDASAVLRDANGNTVGAVDVLD